MYRWAAETELGRYVTAGALAVGAVASGAYYMSRRMLPLPWGHTIDMHHQTIDAPMEPGARMSSLCKNGQLVDRVFSDVKTFYEAVLRGKQISNNGPCLGSRPGPNMPYIWISYEETISRAQHAGAAFTQKVKATNSLPPCIGIYAQNRMEYVLTELACSMYSMVIIPLYDTLGAEACTFIINQASIQLVICDKNSRLKSLLEHSDHTQSLETIVCIEQPTPELTRLAMQRNIALLLWTELEDLGKRSPVPLTPATADKLYMICYTSGTTGLPKGAMITHQNVIAVVSAISVVLKEVALGPQDVLLSFLPLAHIYEQMTEAFMFMVGARVGFYQGDSRLVMADIAELRPTLLTAVPRLLNRIYDKVMGSVRTSGFVKRTLFRVALNRKRSEISRGIIRDNSVWDRLVFKKIRESLGGRVKLLTTGSAPLSADIMDFLRCTVGCGVVEGYGQTECAGVCTLQFPGSTTAGRVGAPLPCNMMKLVDVEEMGYRSADLKGEVCVKGPNVFVGYLGQPDKTAEAIDADGWLHTGDIGQWMENGELRIIDRKKHIFKLSQGEYIAPEKIEMVYSQCETVLQIFVYGDSLKSSCVAIVVPDHDVLPKYAKNKLNITGNMKQLCADPEVKKAVLDNMRAVGKTAGLNSLEQVKDVFLHPDPFTVDSGLLTPTFKMKRPEVVKTFSREIADMYAHLE